MRVHELAKLLEISSKDCIDRLKAIGVEVKSHASTVSAEAVEALSKGNAPAKAVAASAPASAPAKSAAPAAATPKPAPAVAAKPTPAPAAPAPRAPVAPVVVATPPPAPVSRPAVAEAKILRVKGAIMVRELAELLGVRPNALIAELMGRNILASISQKVEVHVAREIAEKHGFQLEQDKRSGEHKAPVRITTVEVNEELDRPEDLVPRAPVVTFLGHVDHGKTSLLDRIRKTSVVEDEFGGITQHIGAYSVSLLGRRITFLDTPGHAAFTAMRARGAHLTDIAVIIVAGDDGIMPQTREAIQHARAAGVKLMVAVNKMDLPASNVERVLRQLQAEGLSPEEWGGDIIVCPVSAQTGAGVEHLLEMILLQADVLELKANPKRRASGYVIESTLEPGMGPTVTLLVKVGTLSVGEFILCGTYCGKVRALINDHGIKIKSAEPSLPVKCLGLSGVPEAGAEFLVYANERVARERAEKLGSEAKLKQLTAPKRVSLENLFSKLEGEKKLELRVVLKADTQGSIEAIQHALGQIQSDKVVLNILLAGTGNITENDVMLARASGGVVLGFCVGKEAGVDSLARREGIEIRLHNIIYEMLDQVRDAMTGLLAPELKETVVGTAQILEVFAVGKNSKVAGCRITRGLVTPKHKVRLRRGTEVLFEGSIASLKHFRDSAAEVRESQECGIRLDRFADFSAGDTMEFYEVEAVRQTL